MVSKRKLLTSAIAGLLALGFGAQASSHEAADTTGKGADAKEKCYGIAKAGQIDCGTARHSCAGKAAKDNAPDEWKYVPKGTCEKMGGKTSSGSGGADSGKAPKYRAE